MVRMAGEAAPSTPESAPNTAPPPTESPDAATSARTKEADTKVADAVQKLVATRNSSLVKESAGNVGSVALGTVKGILDTVMLSAQGMKPSVEKGSLADKAAGVVRDQAESMSRAVGGAKTDVDTWTQQKGQEKAQAQTEIDAVKKVLGVEPAQTGGGQKAGPDTKPMGLPDIGDVVARADAAVRQSAAETPVSTVPTQAELEKVVMVAKSREPSKERPGIDAIAHGLKVRKDQDTPPSPVAAPSPAGPEASKKPAEQSAAAPKPATEVSAGKPTDGTTKPPEAVEAPKTNGERLDGEIAKAKATLESKESGNKLSAAITLILLSIEKIKHTLNGTLKDKPEAAKKEEPKKEPRKKPEDEKKAGEKTPEQKEIDDLKRDIDGLSKKVDTSKTERGNLEKSKRDLQTKIAEIDGNKDLSLEQKQRQKADLQIDLDSLDRSIAGVDMKIKGQTELLKDWQGQLTKKQEALQKKEQASDAKPDAAAEFGKALDKALDITGLLPKTKEQLQKQLSAIRAGMKIDTDTKGVTTISLTAEAKKQITDIKPDVDFGTLDSKGMAQLLTVDLPAYIEKKLKEKPEEKKAEKKEDAGDIDKKAQEVVKGIQESFAGAGKGDVRMKTAVFLEKTADGSYVVTVDKGQIDAVLGAKSAAGKRVGKILLDGLNFRNEDKLAKRVSTGPQTLQSLTDFYAKIDAALKG